MSRKEILYFMDGVTLRAATLIKKSVEPILDYQAQLKKNKQLLILVKMNTDLKGVC
jgi:uncharacterized protein (DUF4213/DUF364 family)